MATIDELHLLGHDKIRLPFWNEFAYVSLGELDDGSLSPWVWVHDIGAGIGGGDPIPMLLASADGDKRWEPVS